MSGARVPCKACPWRKDVQPGTWTASRFQNLYLTCQDDGVATMACHKSTEAEQFACAGFVHQLGSASVGVRLQVFSGKIKPGEFSGGGFELYAGFDEMLEANDVPLPRRNKVVL